MSRSSRSERSDHDRSRPLRVMLCLLLTVFLSACGIIGRPTAPPLHDSLEWAVDVVNRHAAVAASVNAGSCRFSWRYYSGAVESGADYYGSLMARRGSKVRMLWYDSTNPVPFARFYADGKTYSQETREDRILLTGSVDSRIPRSKTRPHFRPHDVARAVCIEPLKSDEAMLQSGISLRMRREIGTINVLEGLLDEPTLRQISVRFVVLTEERLAPRMVLREIWIDPRSGRIVRQFYFDNAVGPTTPKGGTLIAMRYNYGPDSWDRNQQPIFPRKVDLYVGHSEDRSLKSLVIEFANPKQVFTNVPIEDEKFTYVPPKDVQLEKVSEP